MSRKLRFTTSWVETLPFLREEEQRLEFRDTEVSGLVLRVGKTSKSYYLFKRQVVLGRSVERKIKLGCVPQLSLQGARRLAAKQRGAESGRRRPRGSLEPTCAVRLDEEMLTTQEAAALTRMSCAWFERKRWEGQGPPFYRAGRAVRYMKGELLEWWKGRPGP